MGYHTDLHHPGWRRTCVSWCRDALIKHDQPFDLIVVRGISGMSIGSILAYELDKPMLVIRKPGDHSHGLYLEGKSRQSMFESEVEQFRYVVVDDMTESGYTLYSIHRAMRNVRNAYHVITLMYDSQHVIHRGIFGDDGDEKRNEQDAMWRSRWEYDERLRRRTEKEALGVCTGSEYAELLGEPAPAPASATVQPPSSIVLPKPMYIEPITGGYLLWPL